MAIVSNEDDEESLRNKLNKPLTGAGFTGGAGGQPQQRGSGSFTNFQQYADTNKGNTGAFENTMSRDLNATVEKPSAIDQYNMNAGYDALNRIATGVTPVVSNTRIEPTTYGQESVNNLRDNMNRSISNINAFDPAKLNQSTSTPYTTGGTRTLDKYLFNKMSPTIQPKLQAEKDALLASLRSKETDFNNYDAVKLAAANRAQNNWFSQAIVRPTPRPSTKTKKPPISM